jgi:hypothetical protein
MLAWFFPVVGFWNAFGSLVLLGFWHEGFADAMLRKWTLILAKPYSHGTMGHVLFVWIGLLNTTLGICMMLAPGWEPAARNTILIAAIVGYAVFLGLAIAARRSPNYGPGVSYCIGLWSLLLAWGCAVLIAG